MPAGKAQAFKKDMEKLVQDLQAAISQAFESEEYDKQKRAIVQQVGEQQETKLSALNEKAESQGFMIVRTPAGLMFAPKGDKPGEPMAREAYEALPPAEQKKIDDGLEALNEELQGIMRLVRQDERGGRDALRELDQKVTDFAARHLVDETCERWCQLPEMSDYLQAVLKDVVENADDFKKSEEEAPATFMGMPIPQRPRAETAFLKYRINVVVDNSDLQGAPVITETNPVLQNLVGQVEHQAQFGALFTDFTMIKAGALHKANGGFLVLDARDVPHEALRVGRPEADSQDRRDPHRGRRPAAGLRHDGVAGSGADTVQGQDRAHRRADGLLPALRAGPGLSGAVQGQGRLRQRGRSLSRERAAVRPLHRPGRPGAQTSPVLRRRGRPRHRADVAPGRGPAQDDHRASPTSTTCSPSRRTGPRRTAPSAKAPVVKREHVQTAIDQRVYRSNRVEERVREMIADATVMVDTRGAVVGQINGLSVSSIGDYMFGRPSRITATHRLGEGEVVDIEREVEMGGPIHSKGVLILAGYLGSKYAAERPLSLTARLVFEQSYSGVEGDSASSAELYALLSSLSGLPSSRRFAVTGSVNQRGQVQAIGGVNEKIEGFFAVCEALGLKGDETVLIPKSNVSNLMLGPRVREAIAAGKFHIIPVATIDEGISLLTGIPAGELGDDGTYPEGTINRMVVDRLTLLAEKAREAGPEEGQGDPDAVVTDTKRQSPAEGS